MNLIYTVHEKEINISNYNDSIIIWFFGDVHRDSTCDVDRWQRFLNKSAQDDAWYFCMGDTHDFASTSEKKKIMGSYLHEETMQKFDLIVEKDVRSFCQEIKHMKGRLLGFIEGNHHWVYQSGKTSTEDLAERMDAPYLGWLTHYTLSVNFEKSRGYNMPIHIVACHGRSGGKTYGITVNQVADLKMIFPVADIMIMGHDHQRWADSISVLIPTNAGHGWQIKQKEQLLCRSGSFKKSYEPGKAGYEANRLLKPANLGALKVIISFRRYRKDCHSKMYTELSAVV
jgi:hypothetical protein